MTSHEYAEKLEELAAYLKSKPEFDTTENHIDFGWAIMSKDKFLPIVRSLGSGQKEFTNTQLYYRPIGLPADVELRIFISRDKVCRKIQEEKWECEPILSPEEEAELTA